VWNAGKDSDGLLAMRILISGSGIAGPTLAYWLLQYGFTPTILEIAPKLRTGGYIIDFWGAGFEIAERMEVLAEIRQKGYAIRDVRVVNESGKQVAGFPADVFDRMTHGHFVSVPRGDLAASIFRKIEGKVETIFGDSIRQIEQKESSVKVTFERGGVREFDLVVGADGLHSGVRELVFGAESGFEKDLGYRAAAFAVDGYRPRDELVYVMYTEVGQQVVRFAMRGDRTMFFITFADKEAIAADDIPGQKALLRKRFGNSGWECPRILDALDSCNDFYFDRVSQIRMGPQQGGWSRGRVTLIGDAASCVSLLAGQGSALAMVGAYILAGELHRANGNYAEAFKRYEELFGPFVLRKQQAALRFAGSFAPKSKLSLLLRNKIFQLMAIRWIADLAVGRDLADNIELSDY
jgi:2-polyprenyl-6-methoxyphenol hydroxylase-like FAD-dependent oxidoreductase